MGRASAARPARWGDSQFVRSGEATALWACTALGWPGGHAPGQVALQLVATTPENRRVLLPKKAAAPLLHQAVEQQGYGVEPQPAACQEVAAWIKRARDRRLALLVCPDLLRPSWLQRHGLQPLREQPVLVEQLWLLLPQGTAGAVAGRAALQALRRQLDHAETMQDLHEI